MSNILLMVLLRYGFLNLLKIEIDSDAKSIYTTIINPLITRSHHSPLPTLIVAALANNPQVLSKAHEELDRKVKDIVTQLHLGIPHYIDEDDEYNGYHIPANSAVVLNIYGIHMDEKRYENPRV
ncbi:hypothetical protein C2G38_2151121 [Gigaspora rosea]|uniref:Cytochrome P450 n=1 Tax=Gigaspora rosea TaxID=44941 RepID=A0A397W997_9GLOM|nr:hypothetical protein C2G38_2151121 [Gigaspora rosea]